MTVFHERQLLAESSRSCSGAFSVDVVVRRQLGVVAAIGIDDGAGDVRSVRAGKKKMGTDDPTVKSGLLNVEVKMMWVPFHT